MWECLVSVKASMSGILSLFRSNIMTSVIDECMPRTFRVHSVRVVLAYLVLSTCAGGSEKWSEHADSGSAASCRCCVWGFFCRGTLVSHTVFSRARAGRVPRTHTFT